MVTSGCLLQAVDQRSGLEPESGDRLLSLPDGREMAFREFGDPEGSPVIALHGTPGSRLKFSATDEIGRELALRVIAPDRWGYGASHMHPFPSLAAFATDLAALADSLALPRFSLLGVSGGGPYAAAAAALLSSRVAALALAAPVGPIVGEADQEISTFHRFCFGPFARNPLIVRTVFRGFRRLLRISPELAMRTAMLRAPPSDRRILQQRKHRDRLGKTFTEGLRPGALGPAIDLGLFGAPWRIDLSSADMPARIWLGSADENVPRSAARRLVARLPSCTLVELPGEGHLWVAANYAAVLRWIADEHR